VKKKAKTGIGIKFGILGGIFRPQIRVGGFTKKTTVMIFGPEIRFSGRLYINLR
jgi:hypothetical protein